MNDKSIILVGPMGVGKSSVAKELSVITGIDYIDVDEMRWEYFIDQHDYDRELVDRLFAESRGVEAFDYMKPFEARFVIYILNKHPFGIFDFGAGYSVYENNELFEKVKSAFSKYKHIVFLRYSDNKDESLIKLRERHTEIPEELYYSLNKGFIESQCNDILATLTIDTKDKSIEEVVALIIDKWRIQDAGTVLLSP